MSPNHHQRLWTKKRIVLMTSVASLTLITALSLPPILSRAWAELPTTVSRQTIPASFADLVEQVKPAVVSITTTKRINALRPGFQPHPFSKDSPLEEFLRRFLEPQAFQRNQGTSPYYKTGGLGSGFIIDAQGFIVTNHHVVKGAEEINATLNNGNRYPATIVGQDAKTDLALLKVETSHSLPSLSFGDSNQARVGDWVIAVGNPFGFGDTFTAGIISARGRDIQSGPYDDFIQIDAPINQGNSGGPLLNLNGEVIGVNTAIYSPNGGNVGIGFAVPSVMVEQVIAELKAHGHVERGWLGVQIQSISEEMTHSLGMTAAKGALVAKVLPNTPAEQAKILPGDVIIKVDGKTVKDAKDLSRMVAEANVGQPTTIQVWRQGSQKTIQVKLGKMAGEETVTLNSEQESADGQLGLALSEITDQMRRQYQISDEIKGVVIVDVKKESPAAETGLRKGDVILMVGQQPVSTPEQVTQQVKGALQAKYQTLLLLINRQGRQQFVMVKMQNG